MSNYYKGALNVSTDLKLRALVSATARGTTVNPVFRLWQVITTAFFPTAEGYASYLKVPQSKKDDIPDCEVFGVKRVLCGAENPEEWLQKEILVVFCLDAKSDIPEHWNGLKEDLEPYMLQIPHSDNSNGPPGRFVAVVMGRRVKMFAWKTGKTQSIEQLHDEPLDMSAPEDANKVADWLNHFKDETWDYTKWEPAKDSDFKYEPQHEPRPMINIPS
ncbi:hypothetical protein GLAREA_12681 [Glarea lozoyensis ATCC 20868]|uniref:Uncharacterized protein n=1 Tax=Glarea lozoyensis (strain ATCC 20868 / MF5171) TaxID=1116229 RepID=S3DYF5_GLAL2|nr:uncharacterized protein GLAREA_12681 [Glarea lozoyensis ATCC 20868]EPE31378.1 hypothetical protein GLAREA_12681 [Glarea lozoyensis ATCC 20868]